MRGQAVLFDFSDTLFWRDGVVRIVLLAAERGASIPLGVAAKMWADIKALSNSDSEIAKRRDTSQAAHAECWLDLYRPLDFAHGTEKPDPLMFLTACEVLDVDPRRTFMVGDNLRKDGGSVDAGLTALVLPTWPGYGERGLRSVLGLVGLSSGLITDVRAT
jgi:beta-phosphoglucomutase-like phosphatase (HAD superfamily)